MNKLNLGVKKQWIEALRSGKYRQGRLTLMTEDKDGFAYCCLGVACEIGIAQPRLEGLSDFVEYSFLDQSTQDKLVIMNDGSFSAQIEPKSFSQIADWIEENL
jgi:hypothetical protein